MLRTECTATVDIGTWPLLMSLMVHIACGIFYCWIFKVLFQQLAELHISLVFVPRRRYKFSFLYFLAYRWKSLGHGGIRWRKSREKKWVSDLMYNQIVFRSSRILLDTWDDKTKQEHEILIIKIVHVSYCHNIQEK